MPLKTMIRGVRDLDGRFAQMMKIKLLCEEGSVSYPPEVVEYFGGCIKESEAYCRKEMEEVSVDGAMEKRLGTHVSGDQWDIYLIALPQDIVRLRVVS